MFKYSSCKSFCSHHIAVPSCILNSFHSAHRTVKTYVEEESCAIMQNTCILYLLCGRASGGKAGAPFKELGLGLNDPKLWGGLNGHAMTLSNAGGFR